MNLICLANADGVIVDPAFLDQMQAALALGITTIDVVIHGWWTTNDRLIPQLNAAIVGISPLLPPTPRLGIGLHWPSALDEGQIVPGCLTALSYYTMEKRADAVGEHAGFAILKAATDAAKALTINIFGHSFGCKVVCSALTKFFANSHDLDDNRFNVVLLQGAFEHNNLDPGQQYGYVNQECVRMLVTHSKLDAALNEAFPAAQALDFFRKDADRQAIGAIGPTDLAQKVYGERMQVRDVTDIQANYPDLNKGVGGSHSTVLIPELFRMEAEFIEQAAVAA
jgi:Alpha/beta hydrolase of unknown function (DUF900)